MKIVKYIASVCLLMSVVACQKHAIIFQTHELGDQTALFQLHYMEPISTAAANNIDSTFINGVLYASVKGSGSLVPLNGLPGGGIGRFYAVKPGKVDIKLYRKADVVYENSFTLKEGRSHVVIYDMTKEPIILDNLYGDKNHPYYQNAKSREYSAKTFDTDSISSVRFYNFLFEEAGKPYEGKLQYQYRQYDTKDTIGYDQEGKPITEYRWFNLGAPVAFGEATDRIIVPVDKINGINASGYNDYGYQRLYYRILDESGHNLVGYWDVDEPEMTEYSDWWNAYIGRAYNHFLCGIRTSTKNDATETYARVANWTSL